jgi:hypothetical protein
MSVSYPLQSQANASAAKTVGRTARSGWLREPLLHFLILGGLLFAADHLLTAREADPRRIVMDAAVTQEIRQLFVDARGKEPTATELKALQDRWLDNEVLYREGLALQVDRGDKAIRERVIFKALSLIDANVKRPNLDDQVLRAWFEKNRARYDEPVRFDFQEAVLTGENTESAVRQFVRALSGGVSADQKAGLRVFKGRPHDNLVQSYGAEFAKEVETARSGEWRAMPTRDGWRAIRLESVTPAQPAAFEALRGVILQDWTDAVMAEQRTAAVRALARKYNVSYEASK